MRKIFIPVITTMFLLAPAAAYAAPDAVDAGTTPATTSNGGPSTSTDGTAGGSTTGGSGGR